MMSNIPDNYNQWAAHDADQEAELRKLPVCCECGERIQTDELYEINDELVCPQCMEDNHRKWTEDYCE